MKTDTRKEAKLFIFKDEKADALCKKYPNDSAKTLPELTSKFLNQCEKIDLVSYINKELKLKSRNNPSGWRGSSEANRLTDLPENLGLIHGTHVAAHNRLELQFEGIQSSLLASVGTRHTCGRQTHMRQNTHTHKISIYINLKKIKGFHLQ